MKLCIIYNTAPKYREAIFASLDKEYDCDWYFGHTVTDIKEMDTSILRNVNYYKTIGHPDRTHWQRGLIRLLFKKKYQVFFILFETRAPSCWLFVLLASILFPRKKIYLWTHGWYGKESGVEAKMKLWLYKHVAGTFVYSEYARQLLIKEGIQYDKLFTIHNSLHYERQIALREQLVPSNVYVDHFANSNPIIIFIGRLTKVKQLNMLVEAVSDLNKRGENYNLVFVGDGVEKENLINQVESLGLNKQVWFYGACYDEKTNAELIFNADLCVAPGNVGLTAMHTMVFGTPVISHNELKWQMPEFEAIRPGETGAFFDYQNEESLVETISNWFGENSNNREKVRKACYKEIDTQWNPYFQMEVIRKYLKLG